MDAREVVDYLQPEPDEKAVLSAVLQKDAGALSLVGASLLIGPEEMAETSWPSWRRLSGIEHSRPSYEEPEFTHDLGSWVVGRIPMDVAEASRWLAEATARAATATLGATPQEHRSRRPHVRFTSSPASTVRPLN